LLDYANDVGTCVVNTTTHAVGRMGRATRIVVSSVKPA